VDLYRTSLRIATLINDAINIALWTTFFNNAGIQKNCRKSIQHYFLTYPLTYALTSYYRKSNRPQIETILHMVLKFQLFNRACLQKGEARENFGINNIASASPTQTHKLSCHSETRIINHLYKKFNVKSRYKHNYVNYCFVHHFTPRVKEPA